MRSLDYRQRCPRSTSNDSGRAESRRTYAVQFLIFNHNANGCRSSQVFAHFVVHGHFFVELEIRLSNGRVDIAVL